MKKDDILIRIDADISGAESALREAELGLILDSVFSGRNGCTHNDWETDKWLDGEYGFGSIYPAHPAHDDSSMRCQCQNSLKKTNIRTFFTWNDHPAASSSVMLQDIANGASLSDIAEYVETLSLPVAQRSLNLIEAGEVSPDDDGSAYSWGILVEFWTYFRDELRAGTVPMPFVAWLYIREEGVDGLF